MSRLDYEISEDIHPAQSTSTLVRKTKSKARTVVLSCRGVDSGERPNVSVSSKLVCSTLGIVSLSAGSFSVVSEG